MNWAIRAVLALVTGMVVFWVVRYTNHLWFAIALAVASTAFVGMGQALEVSKKALETYKLWQEMRTERKAERERERIVQVASADEIKEYAQSPVERILKDRYTRTGQYFLEPKRFVADCREEKRP